MSLPVLLAGAALVVVWILATVLVYFGVYFASLAVRDLRYAHPLAEDSPWHHFIALVATLFWYAVTANLPLP